MKCLIPVVKWERPSFVMCIRGSYDQILVIDLSKAHDGGISKRQRKYGQTVELFAGRMGTLGEGNKN